MRCWPGPACASSGSSRGVRRAHRDSGTQPEGEWVLVLAGAARLRFQDETEARVLGPGDCIDIAPHRHHRVEWTDPTAPTVWLAVFYPCDTSPWEQGGKPDCGPKIAAYIAKSLSLLNICECAPCSIEQGGRRW
jgi:Cupin domain